MTNRPNNNQEAYMARIGFIGLGNMGLPMAVNLVRAGHAVVGFDVVGPLTGKLSAIGGLAAETIAAACRGADAIITICLLYTSDAADE